MNRTRGYRKQQGLLRDAEAEPPPGGPERRWKSAGPGRPDPPGLRGKLDINDRTVLQTDAPITGGNSGGPAFDLNGNVIGIATFISTSLETNQAIQGFNFLIPVDTIQAMARQIGLTPKADSLFMTEWNQALNDAVAGHLREALEHVDAAHKIVPRLIDVWRTRERIRKRMEEETQSQK